jgi:hypothetical protein
VDDSDVTVQLPDFPRWSNEETFALIPDWPNWAERHITHGPESFKTSFCVTHFNGHDYAVTQVDTELTYFDPATIRYYPIIRTYRLYREPYHEEWPWMWSDAFDFTLEGWPEAVRAVDQLADARRSLPGLIAQMKPAKERG